MNENWDSYEVKKQTVTRKIDLTLKFTVTEKKKTINSC